MSLKTAISPLLRLFGGRAETLPDALVLLSREVFPFLVRQREVAIAFADLLVLDARRGNVFHVTLSGDTVVRPLLHPQSGCYRIFFTQDDVGGWTVVIDRASGRFVRQVGMAIEIAMAPGSVSAMTLCYSAVADRFEVFAYPLEAV